MRDKCKKIVLAIAALFAVSCNTVYEFGECPALTETREVNFVLAIDAPSATRAEWGASESTDEIGTSFENRILPESLRVAVYSTANTHLGDIENLLYWPINDEGTRYQFQGSMPQSVIAALESETMYKFMVFANSTEGDNAALEYTFDDLDMTTGAIPMWGVKQVDLAGLLNNVSQNIGEISLLRAVAKVEVVVDEALSGCTIEAATINYHNRTGYVLPTGWDSATDTKSIDRVGCFRGLRSVHTSPHALMEMEAGEKFVLYIPEYDNRLFADYESKISVSVNYNGTLMSFPDALQFKKYVDGRPTGEAANITRNTIYRFRITKVASGGLELNYEVADWQRSENWEWVHHFDYPNYHNPVLPDSAPRDGSAINDVYPERPEMYYVAPNTLETITTEAGAFSCWFQMTSPVGQHWLPTLRTASNQCVIRVYKEIDPMTYHLAYTTETSVTDASLKDGSQLEAYSGWYNIKVIPIDAEYTGVARFGITYSQDWMGAGSRYLLINGEVDHIIWPNSGNEPRIIDIQQVSN
ncbi:MAG: hypothetical protein IKY50_03790 [Alistipes sp.]|nr:hypothetical protein [Alistipes sp.]